MKKPSSLTRRMLLHGGAIVAAGLLGFFIGEHSEDKVRSAPLIGIPSVKGHDYALAVRRAGGIPVILPLGDGTSKIDEYLRQLDGLLLPGGADIPPSEYGEEPHETTKILSDDRYVFEKALSKAWIEQTNKPLLGVCLGCQWVNVTSGGSLIQDIPSAFDGLNHRVDHPVSVEQNSHLHDIVGQTGLQVNSSHHQAVAKIGEGLRIVARCPNGVVEAIETTRPDRFLIGVQWHPEKLSGTDPKQANLFRAFVEAAAKHSKAN